MNQEKNPNECLKCSTRASFGYDKRLYCGKHKLPDMNNLNAKKCLLCNKPAYYNYVSERKQLYCVDHKLDSMVRVGLTRCKECNNIPLYNFPNNKKATHCEEHKSETMILTNTKICNNPYCNALGKFSLLDNINKLYCRKHKTEEMINPTSSRCKSKGCTKAALFNYQSEIKGLFCAIHKDPLITNVISPRCELCPKIANFNYEGMTKPKYCKVHQSTEMINLRKSICKEPNCNKVPSYNYPNIRTALYCSGHKLPGMVSRLKKCLECDMRASFGYITTREKQYCSKHKLPNMFDLNNKLCIYPNCTTSANYGIKTRMYCALHKLDDMTYICKKSYPKYKCKHLDCNILPSYGNPKNKTVLYCYQHRLPNMVNLTSVICIESNCKNQPLFGYPTGKPLWCHLHYDHDNPEIINLTNYNKCCKCENPYTIEIDNEKLSSDHMPKSVGINLKKLCKYCDLEDDSPYVCDECNQNRNKKEFTVVQYLRKNIDTKFVYDSSTPLNGCSKRRPNIFFDLPLHNIIVEVDEDQHRRYDESCECARINEIVTAIGGKSVIFIRFNPDKFKINDKPQSVPIRDRLELLVRVLKEELTKEYDTFQIRVIQLFYDISDNPLSENPSPESEKYINQLDITKLVTV